MLSTVLNRYIGLGVENFVMYRHNKPKKKHTMYIDVQTVNHVLNQEVNYRYEDCRHNIFFLT